MNNTNYKLFPIFQISLFEFMGSVENAYDVFSLKLSGKEKIKINEIKKRKVNYEIN
jgi:hypothetical protein